MHAKLLTPLATLLLVLGCACGAQAGGPDGSVATGRIQVSWSTSIRGQAVTCARIGARQVVARLRSHSGEDLRFAFPCTDLAGTSSPVAAGAYELTLSLVGADGAPFAEVTQQIAVDAGRTATPNTAVFDVADGTGHVTLSRAALGFASARASQPDGAEIPASGTITQIIQGALVRGRRADHQGG